MILPLIGWAAFRDDPILKGSAPVVTLCMRAHPQAQALQHGSEAVQVRHDRTSLGLVLRLSCALATADTLAEHGRCFKKIFKRISISKFRRSRPAVDPAQNPTKN